MTLPAFERRPLIVAIAGPNGAGKTTFFHAHLATLGLRFVNADVLAVGDKVQFLEDSVAAGYSVVLCFVSLAKPEQSIERVAMRVSQGGHDVPDDKLLARFERSLLNLKSAIHRLPHVLVYDNSDLGHPYRTVAIFEHGQVVFQGDEPPEWLQPFICST